MIYASIMSRQRAYCYRNALLQLFWNRKASRSSPVLPQTYFRYQIPDSLYAKRCPLGVDFFSQHFQWEALKRARPWVSGHPPWWTTIRQNLVNRILRWHRTSFAENRRSADVTDATGVVSSFSFTVSPAKEIV